MDTNKELMNDSGIKYEKEIMHDRIISSGKWFFWIALLSLMNLIFLAFSVDRYFVLGMGIPYFISGILQSGFGLSRIFGIIVNIIFISYFAYMGYLSIQKKNSGFVAGLIIYLLDTIIFITFIRDWMAILFHFIALFMIIRGLYSLIKFKKLDAIQVTE